MLERIVSLCEENRNALFHPLAFNERGKCISSGGRVVSWPLFLTRYPFVGEDETSIESSATVAVDLATARFLAFHHSVLRRIPFIDTRRFRHYGGDNDFSMCAKELGMHCYIVPDARCSVDTGATGESPHYRRTFGSFLRTLGSIRSTNNLAVRLHFGAKHCPVVWLPCYSVSIVMQVFLLYLRSSLSPRVGARNTHAETR